MSPNAGEDAVVSGAHSANVPILREGVASYLADSDPEETQEWMDSLDGLLAEAGPERARYLMLRLLERASKQRVALPALTSSDYVNTIPTSQEPEFPGDETIERRYRKWVRWNAAIMVHRAQRPGIGVGGHISTYAGAAPLYEVGYNYFFRGKDHPGGGDQVFFQGHASPGMYARAFLEGRLTEEQLDGFRQEKSQAGHALPSYPHPRCLPEFWEYPTVSMGIGPMNAIFQARFNKYLANRGIKDTSDQHVWAFLGDGEMDEPESRGALAIAANDALDNLTFVINCNLQRLDGPVRGNGQIIQELESYFRGAGWNVIKVIWGRNWDTLFAMDTENALVDLMNNVSDGDYQTIRANDGKYLRENFFNRDPRTARMVEDWTDDELWALKRGGHDYRKIYAAYKAALEHKGQPTVILAHTIKGYGLGTNFEGRNATHQMKKLTLDDLKNFRDKQEIPITDEELERDPYLPPYYKPEPDSTEIKYLLERRKELGGFVPERRHTFTPLTVPGIDKLKKMRQGSGNQEVATTMASVRILKELMRDPELKKRFVPIIPDEARTFGMDSWFPTLKIYNPHGQNYTSVDHDLMLSYKESTSGQIMHEGINEAGSVSEFTAAGTAYATHGEPMIPVYIFYSMFGFQRTGDFIWAASDQLARGFFLGATAGRTTLTGEGLQHMDGHSQLLAATNPAIVAYDPAFGFELAHIFHAGIERMYGPGSEVEPEQGVEPVPHDEDRNVSYYITLYNEPATQPAEPEDLDVDALLRGLYLFRKAENSGLEADILASGVGMYAAMRAQEILAEDHGVAANLWSATSWNELAKNGLACDRYALRNPEEEAQVPFVTSQLEEGAGPVIAVSDFQRAVPEQIRGFIPRAYYTLGTDGFGFSDTRPAARRFFNTDAESIVIAVLRGLYKEGTIGHDQLVQATRDLEIDSVDAAPEQTSDPGVA